MKVLAILVLMGLQSHVVFAEDNYATLPNASERIEQDGFYKSVPSLYLEIVQEGVGTPDEKLASLVSDADLKAKIEAGHFLSLQVRDFSIIPSELKKDVNSQLIHVPFIVSVKHTQRTQIPYFQRDIWTNVNPNQGTIDVAGKLLIVFAKDHLTVSVETFDDSKFLEWVGRKASFNSEINFAFADAIVKPEVENYFNSNPEEIKKMINAYVPDTPLPSLKDLEHTENVPAAKPAEAKPAEPKAAAAEPAPKSAPAPAPAPAPVAAATPSSNQPNVTVIEPKELPSELRPAANSEHVVRVMPTPAPAPQTTVPAKSDAAAPKRFRDQVLAAEKAPAQKPQQPAAEAKPQPKPEVKAEQPAAQAQPVQKQQPDNQEISAHEAVVRDFLNGKR